MQHHAYSIPTLAKPLGSRAEQKTESRPFLLLLRPLLLAACHAHGVVPKQNRVVFPWLLSAWISSQQLSFFHCKQHTRKVIHASNSCKQCANRVTHTVHPRHTHTQQWDRTPLNTPCSPQTSRPHCCLKASNLNTQQPHQRPALK